MFYPQNSSTSLCRSRTAASIQTELCSLIHSITMELWETDLKKISACRYLLTRLPGGKTDVALELYVRDNPIVRTIFRLLMEKKLTVFFENSLANLTRLCEKAER